MSDLWGSLKLPKENQEESKAKILLEEQAVLLEEKTEGRIKAIYSPLVFLPSDADILSQGITAALGGAVINREEKVDDVLIDKIDANDMYSFKSFKFEIYNDTYKFRVFTVKDRVFLPITIKVDEGIAEELSLFSGDTINIASNSELESTVSSIFSSKKLMNIIRKMMSL